MQTQETSKGEISPARARAIAWGLSALSFGALFWLMLFPRSYSRLAIVLTALLPLVALRLQFTGDGAYRLRLDARKGDPHPSLLVPLMIPGLALMVRSVMEFNLLEWRVPVVLGALGTAIYAAFIWRSDAHLRAQGWVALLALPLVFPYPYGLLATVNGAFDSSEPQVFSVEVLGKWVSRGKGTAYHVTLAPWGPSLEPRETTVSRPLYEHIGRGGHVWVLLKHGALGMPWYVVQYEAQ
jgi:hypothetical protein